MSVTLVQCLPISYLEPVSRKKGAVANARATGAESSQVSEVHDCLAQLPQQNLVSWT